KNSKIKQMTSNRNVFYVLNDEIELIDLFLFPNPNSSSIRNGVGIYAENVNDLKIKNIYGSGDKRGLVALFSSDRCQIENIYTEKSDFNPDEEDGDSAGIDVALYDSSSF